MFYIAKSPDLYGASASTIFVISSHGELQSGLKIWRSYGRIYFRWARTTTITAMRGTWTRMVSSTTTTMSRIPTGEKSPYTGSLDDIFDWSWCVMSDGVVNTTDGFDVDNSYGERSPDLENDDNMAWYVRWRGSVDCSLDYRIHFLRKFNSIGYSKLL